MDYDAMQVELISKCNTITPKPELSLEWTNLEKLQWHLGCSIAYLKLDYDPVEIPKIQIVVYGEEFAIKINGTGTFESYNDAWARLIHIFDGMRAVYSASMKRCL